MEITTRRLEVGATLRPNSRPLRAFGSWEAGAFRFLFRPSRNGERVQERLGGHGGRLPPETRRAVGSNSHKVEFTPLGMSIKHQDIATLRNLAIQMRCLMPPPSTIYLRILILRAVLLVFPVRERPISNDDSGRRTWIVIRTVDLPRLRVERLGDVGGAYPSGTFEGNRVTNDAITRCRIRRPPHSLHRW